MHDKNMSRQSRNRSSVDNLIEGIRKLHNKSKTSSRNISCKMVDEKLARRSTANQRQIDKSFARALKEFEETYKKRSFYEKVIERSRTVTGIPSYSTGVSDGHGRLCSCEKIKNETSRSFHKRKTKNSNISYYTRIPQVSLIF